MSSRGGRSTTSASALGFEIIGMGVRRDGGGRGTKIREVSHIGGGDRGSHGEAGIRRGGDAAGKEVMERGVAGGRGEEYGVAVGKIERERRAMRDVAERVNFLMRERTTGLVFINWRSGGHNGLAWAAALWIVATNIASQLESGEKESRVVIGEGAGWLQE